MAAHRLMTLLVTAAAAACAGPASLVRKEDARRDIEGDAESDPEN